MSVSISKLQPTQGYILLEPVKTQKKTSSGIYLPDSHDEKPQQAKVLAVGPDTKKEKLLAKKEKLLFIKNGEAMK